MPLTIMAKNYSDCPRPLKKRPIQLVVDEGRFSFKINVSNNFQKNLDFFIVKLKVF